MIGKLLVGGVLGGIATFVVMAWWMRWFLFALAALWCALTVVDALRSWTTPR